MKWVGWVVSVAFLSACVLAAFVFSTVNRKQHLPYSSEGDLLSAIKGLPFIGQRGREGSGQEWRAYVAVARRMRATRPDVIASALHGVSPPAQVHGLDLLDGIRSMLLLRVCFECPERGVDYTISGGWISFSAFGDKRSEPTNCNWPVACAFGRFHSIDTLDGYDSYHPYDPAAEFRWMLINCRWRDL
jgi:hypothetical protein